MGRPATNLVGKRYGALVVVRRHGTSKNKSQIATWWCRCDCGVEKELPADRLKNGNAHSCGCQKRERLSVAMKARNYTRERNPNWKGGRSLASNGYVIVRVGTGHHLADVRGYAYEHRVVAEQTSGHMLADGEVVHHRNEVKHDNGTQNLQICTQAEHRAIHRGR